VQYYFQIPEDIGLLYQRLSWVCLRKSKLQGKPLARADQSLKFAGEAGLLEANIGFRDFKDLRGTPHYDEQGKKEAFAMLRQLGSFTLFYTFGMADMKCRSSSDVCPNGRR
jgi:hypothetical protein